MQTGNGKMIRRYQGSKPRQRKVSQSSSSRRRGLAAVELGLLLPLLLLIVLGTIDFGRFGHQYFGVTNAARAGAGYGMMHPVNAGSLDQWQAAIKAEAVEELSQTLSSHQLTAADVTVTSSKTAEGSNPSAPWYVTVTVSMPFRSITNYPFIPQNVTLSKTVIMRGIR